MIALVLGLVACNKTTQPEVTAVPEKDGMLFVSMSPVNSESTKADASVMTAMQADVRSIQVFVFSAENNASLGLVADEIETSKFVSGNTLIGTPTGAMATANPIALTTYLGKKKVIALVNAPRQENITTLDNLLKRVSNLSENYIIETDVSGIKRDGMVMAGAYGYNYTATSSGNGIDITPDILEVNKKYDKKDDTSIHAIDIPVYRLGARIEVGSVKVNFSDTDLNGKSFTIKDIKLKNVVNSVHFKGGNSDLLDTDTRWTMRLATTGANIGNYQDYSNVSVADKLQDIDLVIDCPSNNTSTAVNKSYIVYPNPCDDPTDLSGSNASTWSKRRTRLVIHAVIGGTENSYYSFSIADPANIVGGQDGTNGNFSSIVGNRRYIIDNINITMKGKPNDSDDMLPATGRVSATIKVQDWAGETLLTYEF